MNAELKPCPFCGGSAAVIVAVNECTTSVGCSDEGCIGHRAANDFIVKKQAIETWNRRATPAPASGERVLALAERIAKAVAEDEGDECWGCDIAAGLFGPRFSEIVQELVTPPATTSAAAPAFLTREQLEACIDPSLPPDVVELRGANRIRWNTQTGEITEFAAHQPLAQDSAAAATVPMGEYKRLQALVTSQGIRLMDLEAAAGAIPAGFNLVPIEPTEAMHVAAVRAIQKCSGNDDFPPTVYKAMLAAAPSPSEPVAQVIGYVHHFDWQPHESERLVKITRNPQPQHGITEPVAQAEQPRARLAEPEGEPDAWLYTIKEPGRISVFASIDPNDTTWWPVTGKKMTQRPLYTAPPTAESIRAQALEDAARVCDTLDEGDCWPSQCAEAIRNLDKTRDIKE